VPVDFQLPAVLDMSLASSGIIQYNFKLLSVTCD
jgi:hypothetical protein